MTDEKQGLEHVIGSAVMDHSYQFTICDEDIYAFLGEKVVAIFTAFIHPDDRDAFVYAAANCGSELGAYVNARIKNYTGKYVMATIYMKPSTIDPNKFISVEIYDVEYVVEEYKWYSTAYARMNTAIKLINPVATFVYDPRTDVVQLYTDMDDMMFEGSLDNLCELIIDKKIIDPAQVSALRKFATDIKKSAVGLNNTFNMKVFEDTNDKKPVKIKTAVVYDKYTATVDAVVGAVVADEYVQTGMDKLYNSKSNLDPLTGLYNKAAIKEIATDAISDPTQIITYIMLDLDHFKEVNDTYGHMFGDEVILNVARIIKEIVGKKGYVGRVGGDEFFVVLKNIGSELEDLRPVLRAIRTQVEWAYKGKLGSIKLTTSIGCANYPKDATNYDDLFKLADRCLYIAKAKGRNRFIMYTKEIHGSLEEIKTVDNSIKIGRTVSDLDMLEFVTDAVTRLSDWRSGVINSVLKDMLPYFSSDVAAIYDVSSGEKIYSAIGSGIEDEEPDPNVNTCTFLPAFKSVFRESNTFYYGDSVNLKMPYPDYFTYTEVHDYRSLFIYAIKDKGEIAYLAVAYAKGRYEKWSDQIINCLSIIFKTMGDKILNP